MLFLECDRDVNCDEILQIRSGNCIARKATKVNRSLVTETFLFLFVTPQCCMTNKESIVFDILY